MVSFGKVIPIRPQQKIVGYKVVTDIISSDMSRMEMRIMQLINQGYQPFGETKALGHNSIFQVMVKYE